MQLRAKIWYPLLLYSLQLRRADVSRNQLQLARRVTVVVGQVDRKSVTFFLKNMFCGCDPGAHCALCSLVLRLSFRQQEPC